VRSWFTAYSRLEVHFLSPKFWAELCAHLVMRELLGHPPPKLTSTLGELFTRLAMQGLLRYPIPELPYTPDNDVDAVHA
jgi:hypothetical protein